MHYTYDPRCIIHNTYVRTQILQNITNSTTTTRMLTVPLSTYIMRTSWTESDIRTHFCQCTEHVPTYFTHGTWAYNSRNT